MHLFKNWRKFWLTGLCAIMLIAVGCQNIGNVDLNKALLSSFDMDSMEGSGYLELALELDDSVLQSADEQAGLQLFKNTKLRFDHIKQEDKQHVSVKGALEIAKGEIPFQAYVSPEALVVWPEGAKKPFGIRTTSPDVMELLSPGSAEWAGALQEKVQEPDFLKPLYTYLVGKLPNPSDLSLNSGTETINGQGVFLHHVTATLDVEEILPLLRTFIVNLMQDDQAMKAVIAEYYDVLLPALQGFIGETELLGDFTVPVLNVLDDRTAGIEVLHTELKQLLVVLLVVLERAQEEAPAFFSDDSSFKVDLYVDSSMKVRKSGFELHLAPAADMETDGVKSVKVKTSFENWNVNQSVKADVLSIDDAILVEEEIVEPAELLQHLDEASLLYRVLKDDLHVGRKSAHFFIMQPSEMEEYHAGWAGYFQEDVTMIPARSLTEAFDLDLVWDAETHSALITATNGSSIRLTEGSTTALVNGESITLEQAPTITEGYFYVPLRAVSEALGAKVVWQPQYSTVEVILD